MRIFWGIEKEKYSPVSADSSFQMRDSYIWCICRVPDLRPISKFSTVYCYSLFSVVRCTHSIYNCDNIIYRVKTWFEEKRHVIWHIETHLEHILWEWADKVTFTGATLPKIAKSCQYLFVRTKLLAKWFIICNLPGAWAVRNYWYTTRALFWRQP